MNDPDDPLRGKLPDPQPGKKQAAPKLQLQRRQELEQRLRSDPNDRNSFLELAAIYRDEHRPLEAKRVLQQAKQIFPGDADIQWQWEEAVLARSLQQFREANDLAGRVQSAEADEELEKSQRDWITQRIEICRDRLRRDHSLDHLRIVLAEALLDEDNIDEAINELPAALENPKVAPQAYLLRGRCELAQGKQLEAMKSLRAAALRRATPAPLKIRIASLRMLCETAGQLGVTETLQHYQTLLAEAELQLTEAATT